MIGCVWSCGLVSVFKRLPGLSSAVSSCVLLRSFVLLLNKTGGIVMKEFALSLNEEMISPAQLVTHLCTFLSSISSLIRH